MSANSILKANLESGQRSEEFWLQVPMGEIGQERTLLPATCMVHENMQTKQGKQRRAEEETRDEESNSEIRTAV